MGAWIAVPGFLDTTQIQEGFWEWEAPSSAFGA